MAHLNKTLISSTGENVIMIVPLPMFDHLKEMLESVDLDADTFDGLPEEQKEIVRSWLKEMEDILRPDLEDFFHELFESLHDRWTKEKTDAKRDPQQIPEENS